MPEERKKRVAIIATHGTVVDAYPPLILATTAAAMGMEAAVYFTFFGLQVLKKGAADELQVDPVAEMPMPVPAGVGVETAPAMVAAATSQIKQAMKQYNVARLSDLLSTAVESGVKLIACEMTMGLMGVKKEDLIDGIEVGGAATFLGFARDSAITLAF